VLTVSYDPATHTIVGSINGVPTAAINYTANGIKYVGIEGSTSNRSNLDHFIVQTGSVAPAAPVVAAASTTTSLFSSTPVSLASSVLA
jgi:hypothetical protein